MASSILCCCRRDQRVQCSLLWHMAASTGWIEDQQLSEEIIRSVQSIAGGEISRWWIGHGFLAACTRSHNPSRGALAITDLDRGRDAMTYSFWRFLWCPSVLIIADADARHRSILIAAFGAFAMTSHRPPWPTCLLYWLNVHSIRVGMLKEPQSASPPASFGGTAAPDASRSCFASSGRGP